MEPQDSLLCP